MLEVTSFWIGAMGLYIAFWTVIVTVVKHIVIWFQYVSKLLYYSHKTVEDVVIVFRVWPRFTPGLEIPER